MAEMAKILHYPEDKLKYMAVLKAGKKAYEKLLWNGTSSR